MRASLTRGLSANIVGGLMPMVVTLAVTPIYIHTIGLERFGVLSLVWLLLGYLGIFDLGFGRAIVSGVARAESAEKRAGLLGTGLLLSTASGFFAAALALALGWIFFDHIVGVGNELGSETRRALPLLAAILPVVTGSSVLAGYLQGLQQFGRLNLTQVVGMTLFQVLPLIVAISISVELPFLAAGAFLGRLAGAGLLAWFCLAGNGTGPRPRFERSEVRKMLGFGGWVMLYGVAAQLILTMDRFLIGALLSLEAVAIYSIPYNVIIRATLIPYSWYSVLFPRLAAAAEKDAKDLLKFGSRVLLLAVTPAAVAGLLILRPFLELWIGKDIANEATPPGLVLMAGFWFYALTFMPLAYFQARERARIPALTYVAEIVIFAPLLYFLIAGFGVVGAAVAWLLRVALDGAFQFGLAGQLRTYLANLALGVPAISVALVWEIWSVDNPHAYTGKTLIFLATIAYVLLLATPEERSRAVGFSRNLLRPGGPKE